MRVGLGAEEGKEARLDVIREDLLNSLLVEIDNKGQRLASDEGSNGSLCDIFGQHSAAIINSLQQKHSLALNLVLGSDLAIGGDAGSSSEASLRCVRYLWSSNTQCHVLAWKVGTFNHRRQCFNNISKELKPQQ